MRILIALVLGLLSPPNLALVYEGNGSSAHFGIAAVTQAVLSLREKLLGAGSSAHRAQVNASVATSSRRRAASTAARNHHNLPVEVNASVATSSRRRAASTAARNHHKFPVEVNASVATSSRRRAASTATRNNHKLWQIPPRNNISIAMVVTGQVKQGGAFAATAKNSLRNIIEPLRGMPGASVDVFLHLKGNFTPDMLETIQSWRPTYTDLYEDEPAEFYEKVDSVDLGTLHKRQFSLMIQRFQWNVAFQKVAEVEAARARKYDFVIRTRPDILYDPETIHPLQWDVWTKPDAKTAYGLCKCHRMDLMEDKSLGKAPVQDVFFVAPRPVAERMMTTWNRILEKPEQFQLRALLDSTRCYMGKTYHDMFECATIADLQDNSFDMSAIQSTFSTMRTASARRTIVGRCSVNFKAGGWTLFHQLNEREQACFTKNITSNSSKI